MKAIAAVVYTTVTKNTTDNAVVTGHLTLTPLYSQPKRRNKENPNSVEFIFMVFNIKNVERLVPLQTIHFISLQLIYNFLYCFQSNIKMNS